MNVWTGLMATFDLCQDKFNAQNVSAGTPPLAGVYHQLLNATIEVALNGRGEFISAVILEKDQRLTVSPVTSESILATNGKKPNPHGLVAKLSFCAGDFSQYAPEDHNLEKFSRSFQAYYAQLQSWSIVSGLKKIQAIAAYVRSQNLTTDLIESGIIPVDGDGFLLRTWDGDPKQLPALMNYAGKKKVNGVQKYDLSGINVRWAVYVDDETPQTWLDPAIQNSWIKFATENETLPIGLCQLTGKMVPIARLHAKAIHPGASDNKLISSNDKDGFTWRGRMAHRDDIAAIGVITTQKIHNTLTWLLKRQGYYSGNVAIVSWTPGGTEIQLVDGLCDIDDEPIIEIGDVGERYSKTIKNSLLGYSTRFPDTSATVCCVMLDYVLKGRLAVTHYSELPAGLLVTRVAQWNDRLAWNKQHFDKVQGKFIPKIGAPRLRDIAQTCYGHLVGKIYKSLEKRLISELSRCIIEGLPLPAIYAELAYEPMRQGSIKPGEKKARRTQPIVGIETSVQPALSINQPILKRKSKWHLTPPIAAAVTCTAGCSLSLMQSKVMRCSIALVPTAVTRIRDQQTHSE